MVLVMLHPCCCTIVQRRNLEKASSSLFRCPSPARLRFTAVQYRRARRNLSCEAILAVEQRIDTSDEAASEVVIRSRAVEADAAAAVTLARVSAQAAKDTAGLISSSGMQDSQTFLHGLWNSRIATHTVRSDAILAVERRRTTNDEVASEDVVQIREAEANAAAAVALARAAAQAAKDAAALISSSGLRNSVEDYSSELQLQLERLRLRLLESNMFDAAEEGSGTAQGFTKDWNYYKPSAGVESADGVQGDYLTNESIGTVKVDLAVPIVAKSKKRIERLAKRRHSTTKSKVVISPSAPLASPSRQARLRRSSSQSTSTDPITSFLNASGSRRTKLLTVEEEIELSRKVQGLLALEAIKAKLQIHLGREPTLTEWAKAADLEMGEFSARYMEGRHAKERMIMSNLRLVISVAKKYQNRGLSLSDLIQKGSMGLIRGCEKFDPDKGFRFSTYAHWWIRQAVSRAITEQSRTVRIPAHLYEDMARIQKARRLLSQEFRCPPRDSDVADIMGMTVEKLRSIMKSMKSCKSLEKPVGKDMDTTLGELIADKTLEDPESAIMKQLFKQDMNRFLQKTLSERELTVIRLRYGLEDGRMRTLEEIGRSFNVTRERVRQIQSKAMRKLKQPERNSGLKGYAGSIL